MKFVWVKDQSGNFQAKVSEFITLGATPQHTTSKGFICRPKRGTKWRAWASVYDDKSTISRYGRDTHNELCETAKDAMRLAETIYNEATTP